MAEPTTPGSVLEREFLTIRSRLLDLAAALDRLDRAGEPVESSQRRQIRTALAILAGDNANCTEQVQMAFSLPFDPQWRAG